jgi:hypothetical protein
MRAIGMKVIVPFVPLAFVVVWPLVTQKAGMAAKGGRFRERSLRKDVLLVWLRGREGRREGGRDAKI